MTDREAAPLTTRLLARKRDAAPSGATRPPPEKIVQPQQTTAAPRVQNVHTASPTLHTVDLTPPDFLRSENRDLPTKAQNNRDDTS